MNFLPEDYVEKRQATRAAAVFIGLLIVVIGGICGAWFYTQWQANRTFDNLDKVRTEYEQANSDLAEMQRLHQEKDRMMNKAEITTTLMERVRRSDLLKELTTQQPKGVSLLTLELKSKEIQVTPRGTPMSDLEKSKLHQEGKSQEDIRVPQWEVGLELMGLAATDGQVAQYIAALGKSSLLKDVNLLFSEEYKKPGTDGASGEVVRRFRVEMKVNPLADLRGLAQAN